MQPKGIDRGGKSDAPPPPPPSQSLDRNRQKPMRSPRRPRTTTRCEKALAAVEGLGVRDYTLAAVAAMLHAKASR
jgi:hypothetical protein